MNESVLESKTGHISAINGSLIKVKDLEKQVRLHDLIKVLNHNILGEVIQIYSNYIVVQCYDNTFNVKLGEDVLHLKEPLSMELAPGLLGRVFDGIQRPLEIVFENFKSGGLERGFESPSLSRSKNWHFIPQLKLNDKVNGGDIVGIVQETISIEHKIMVPFDVSGKLSFIVSEGDYTIIEDLYSVEKNGKKKSFTMLQKWPITKSRPFKEKKKPYEPLITGLRVIDLLFPIAKGGSVAVPGGFGTGKTIIQHSLAKFCDADIIVYIGCGEPGNEIANVLKQFTETIDPKTGRPIIDRIVLIANTSNMPVSAREASLFSGVTIAEYYRDMGYDIAVLPDSTSRWAESLREISGLLEEMPAEEGYPAYLPSKLSSFYERAGIVKPLGKDSLGKEREGSLTIIGTISPPAGDFSEPVTAITKRVVQAFLALDSKLSYLKHYPAINWQKSYSNYSQYLTNWWYQKEKDIDWEEIYIDWEECRKQVNEILSLEQDIAYITQLVGEKNLQEDQKLIMQVSRLIKNGFLIQSSFDDIDSFTDAKKMLGMIKLILLIYKEGKLIIKRGYHVENFITQDIIHDVLRIKQTIGNGDFHLIEEIKNEILHKLRSFSLL